MIEIHFVILDDIFSSLFFIFYFPLCSISGSCCVQCITESSDYGALISRLVILDWYDGLVVGLLFLISCMH